ncbi:hypothetical protein WS71_11940 [Burkholderia mayonis]|uniref:Uncharacterized protein n=2 Tax=Burkholderia mayonis TaxID=1385591 RepID=A0A1B4FW71_9BURK|nr:hypothetical protein WS71_11940 [Burkholderia mayonis]KVE55432.1 hypothetical protein WS71_03035 [Burkholderia mayonis]
MLWRLRLRLLRHDLASDLRRHRDVVIILLSLLPFGVEFVGWPFAAIGRVTAHSVAPALIGMALLAAGAASWAHAFRRSLGGGGFYGYLRCLPIPRAELRRLDTLVLLIANFPLCASLGSGIVQSPGCSASDHGCMSLYGLRIAFAFGVCLLVQIAMLRRARDSVAMTVAACAWLLTTLWVQSRTPAIALTCAGVVFCIAVLSGQRPWSRRSSRPTGGEAT